MSAPLPDLSVLITRLRRDEPAARAFLLFGSFARRDAGSFSAIDLRIITTGSPVERDRVAFLTINSRLVHVSIEVRPLAELVAASADPACWRWLAGFCAAAQVLDDPDGLLAVLRAAVAAYRPERSLASAQIHYHLETLIESHQEVRHSAATGDTVTMLIAARTVADHAATLLAALSPPVPDAGGGASYHQIVSLARTPPTWAADYRVCAGLTLEGRTTRMVAAAAGRITTGVLCLLREDTGLSVPGALGGYLADGTLLRYLQQEA